MSASKSIASYKDVKAILDEIIARNKYPVKNTLPSRGAALHWKQRAHAFRVLDRKQNAIHAGIPEELGESPYDELMFRHPKETPNVIIIEKQVSKGVLSFPDGDESLTDTLGGDDDLIKL